MQSLTSFLKSLRKPELALLVCMLLAASAGSALAQSAVEPPPAEAAAPAAPPPPPYSLPWQLRPVAAATVIRSDTAFAFYENPVSGESGTTIASMLLGSYKLTPEFAPLVRLGVVSNSPPDGSMTPTGAALESAFNFINPVIGGTYVFKLSPDFKLAAFLGLTVPIGGGGGDTPDPSNAAANAAGATARSAMDNAMFAVNYFTVFPGLGLAFIKSGFTAQAEVTLLQLFRVRGKDGPPAAGGDSTRTNMTMGLHLGYFFIPQLSAGAELRYQRWLSTPSSIKAGVMMRTEEMEDTLRDNTTVALGLRGHIKLGETSWIRPGVSFALPLDDPMSDAKYKILQLDIPVIF